MVQFSLVLPTLRGRADCLRGSLRTLVAQDYRDLEIVVQNNGADPRIREAVQAVPDGRVRYRESPDVIPMSDNWEMAVEACEGRYITVIGDDDGLLPGACSVAHRLLGGEDPPRIIGWRPAEYWWPSFPNPRLRNRVDTTFSITGSSQVRSGTRMLHELYAFERPYWELPSIYWSFVSRDCIEEARSRFGRYFLGGLPDVCSAITNCGIVDPVAWIETPLSVRGASEHSFGASRWMHRAPRPEDLTEHFPALAGGARVFGNIAMAVADEMALVQQRQFPSDASLTISERQLIRHLAATINLWGTERYADAAEAVRSGADSLGMEVELPEPEARSLPTPGIRIPAPGVCRVTLDGGSLGWDTVADVASVLGQLVPLPELSAFNVASPGMADAPRLDSSLALDFSAGAPGTAALVSGWGQPEDWGVWSVARRARLRVFVPTLAEGTLISLQVRSAVFAAADELDVRCVAGDTTLAEWHFDASTWRSIVRLDLPAGLTGSPIELDFYIDTPRSPPESLPTGDTRELGIGIEKLALLDADGSGAELEGLAGTIREP